jgi:hypothetical protein
MRIANVIPALILCAAAFLTAGCDPRAAESAKNQERFDALDKVDRNSIPVGSNFIRLYPDATIKYLDISGSDFPALSYDTTLFQRYTLTLEIPVFYSKDEGGDTSVSGFGDPKFYVFEVQKIVPRDGRVGEVDYGNQQFQFGRDEWKKLMAADGDFTAIGHPLIKDQPVEGFELIKAQNAVLSRMVEKQQEAEQVGDR